LSTKWLQTILQDTGVIQESNTIASLEAKTLTGGCHFSTSRVKLEYSSWEANSPNSLVVKVLAWDKNVFQKIILYIKKLFEYPGNLSLH
jgi:hypothetical protein